MPTIHLAAAILLFFQKRILCNSNQSWCRSIWAFTLIICKGTHYLLICVSNFSTHFLLPVICYNTKWICRSKCHSVQNNSRKMIKQLYWYRTHLFYVVFKSVVFRNLYLNTIKLLLNHVTLNLNVLAFKGFIT